VEELNSSRDPEFLKLLQGEIKNDKDFEIPDELAKRLRNRGSSPDDDPSQ